MAETNGSAAAGVQRVLSEYKVLTELGRGAMGVVYLGQHKALGHKVAIKQLLGQVGASEHVRSRFKTEAKVLASLDHPHVVRFYDFVDRDGSLLVVMDQLPGGTVWDRFSKSGFTPPQAVAVVMATCSGLQHAHERDVVHRDVKPENLMFAADGSLKVTDFGIAKVVSGQQTMATIDGSVLGTPAYMAPEQAMAAEIGPAADVYACGVMLYELLSGRLPFPETDSALAMLFQRVNETPEPIWNHAEHVPPVVGEAVMKALAREPSDRWTTPEEFGVAIGQSAATAWGTEWLHSSGLAIKGSERLSIAARTTQSPRVVPEPVVDLNADSVEARQSAANAAPGTVIGDFAPAAPSPEAAPTPAAPTPVAPAPAAPAPAAAPTHAPTAAVLPAAREHVQGGIDLAALDPEDLVDVDEVLKRPSFPIIQLVAAVAAFAAMVLIALNPLGDAPREIDSEFAAAVAVNGETIDKESSIELDLSEAITIDVDQAVVPGASEAELAFSLLGMPVGSMSEDLVGGSAVIEPGPFQFVVTGGLTGTVTVLDATETELGASDFKVWIENGWLTAFALVGVLLALGVLAYFESNARPLRKGRRRIGRLIGLGLTGAVAGVTAVAAVSIIKLFEPTIPTIVACAVLGAISFVAIGLTLLRLGRRRRLKTAR